MANEYNIISDEALDALCGAIKGIANAGEILDDTGVAMDKTYSSFKIQEELDKKIEGDNVVKKDDIVTVLDDSATDEQVPSAKTVVDELGLKANDSEVVKKTDIVTTIDSTSTDEQVASAKVIYDNITSIMSASPSSYSLDEQVIGTWIDGKPIYRKVISKDYIAGNSSTSTQINISELNCKDVIKIYGRLNLSTATGSIIPFPYMFGSNHISAFLSSDEKNLNFACTANVYNIKIVIEYTKTTD